MFIYFSLIDFNILAANSGTGRYGQYEAQRAFNNMDLNGDGILNRHELAHAFGGHRHHHHHHDYDRHRPVPYHRDYSPEYQHYGYQQQQPSYRSNYSSYYSSTTRSTRYDDYYWSQISILALNSFNSFITITKKKKESSLSFFSSFHLLSQCLFFFLEK